MRQWRRTVVTELFRGAIFAGRPRAIIEKLSTMQMIDIHLDIHLPTTDGKHIVLSRYTEPEPDVALLLAQFQLTLPPQSPPKVYASGKVAV